MDDGLTVRAQKRIESDARILQAAAKIFGRLGYSQATLTSIAEEAGVSQGLVSQRFHSKENLLHEVFDQTRILSFYDEESRHLPQAFYVLLEQLKREAEEEPEWFRFLSMIHTGKDTPKSFEEYTKELFTSTPLCAAIAEAQERNDLPSGDPWDIFRVFFRNATNLIGWYHEFGLPMPENDSFLYAIQYNRTQKDAEERLNRQEYEIRTLQTDRDILFTAVSELYPLIIFCNLTQNSYYMLEYRNFTTKRAKENGSYDDLICVGEATIPDEIQREQFRRMFERENVIRAYESGKRQLCLRHLQTGDDGIIRWIETRLLFKGCACGEIQVIVLSKQIDDEMDRLHSYGEALQNAELAEGAKSRFLTNLSHNLRTEMNTIIGYTELLSRHTEEPEKVRDYGEKLRLSERALTDILTHALDAANLSPKDSGKEIRLSINECSGGIFANAKKLARLRDVMLDVQIGTIHDDGIYANEIRLQRTVMSLLIKAINESVAGDCVQVKLEQLEDHCKDRVHLRLSIHSSGVGTSAETLRRILDESQKTEGIAMNISQICEDIRSLGGTIEIHAEENGNAVICAFRFRRAM